MGANGAGDIIALRAQCDWCSVLKMDLLGVHAGDGKLSCMTGLNPTVFARIE